MIKNPGDKDLPTKQEANAPDHKASAASSGLWSGLKNPRIVRVSRAFGGKDRHSKVSTIRGLRDRRVRLSVPTAIQLYDLQDRLGVNQPSKVVDWLLNAAQEEIDKLPPLQIPQGNFIQIPQSLPQPHDSAPSHSLAVENFKYTNDNDYRQVSSPSINKSNIEGLSTFPQSYWNLDAPQRSEQEDEHTEKGNTMKNDNVDTLPRHSLLSGFVSNKVPYSSYYHWEASNAYLSQLGNRSSQAEGPHMSIPSPSLSLAPESQIVLYPPGVVPTSMFPSYVSASTDFNTKQFVQTQMALQTPQSNDTDDPLQLGGPSVRHFQ